MCGLCRERKSKAETSTVKPSTDGKKITAKRTVWQPVLGATAVVFAVASFMIDVCAFQVLLLRANLGTAVTD
jgi:hypothetical protein